MEGCNFIMVMEKQIVHVRDLGNMDYQAAWDYQEALLQENVKIKSALSREQSAVGYTANHQLQTANYLLFVEHPPVYTLGKSGKMDHVLINEDERREKGIQFFQTNRGGDITFHGAGQVVGYPIIDLENFDTDIGRLPRSGYFKNN